ncbi:hypothetical protein CB1_000410005 [Camelus ferus]|nr:hypothetical protein CB1_000410005 [Camelus ferus]
MALERGLQGPRTLLTLQNVLTWSQHLRYPDSRRGLSTSEKALQPGNCVVIIIITVANVTSLVVVAVSGDIVKLYEEEF